MMKNITTLKNKRFLFIVLAFFCSFLFLVSSFFGVTAHADVVTDDNKYYYIYDTTERYVLDSEFTDYKTSQNRTTAALSQSVTNAELSIGTLANLTTENKNTLVYAVNELHSYVSRISDDLDTLITGEGIISSMQKAIDDLEKEISDKYVTIESITKEDPNLEYIFVKKSEFDTYKTTSAESLATQVNTEKVVTNNIVMGSHTMSTDDSDLLFNDEPVAFVNQIPVIEVLDSESFEAKTDIDDNTYYYVYDENNRYVLDSEFSEYKSSQTKTITNVTENVTKAQSSIGDLVNLTTENKNTLVLAINELVSKINDLTAEIDELKNKLNNSEPSE